MSQSNSEQMKQNADNIGNMLNVALKQLTAQVIDTLDDQATIEVEIEMAQNYMLSDHTAMQSSVTVRCRKYTVEVSGVPENADE